MLDALSEGAGVSIEEIRVDGGAARNDLLMQVQADLFGLPIARPSDLETTSRGAAALAAVGAGVLREPAQAAALREAPRRFLPRLAPAERERRLETWRASVARVLTSRRETK